MHSWRLYLVCARGALLFASPKNEKHRTPAVEPRERMRDVLTAIHSLHVGRLTCVRWCIFPRVCCCEPWYARAAHSRPGAAQSRPGARCQGVWWLPTYFGRAFNNITTLRRTQMYHVSMKKRAHQERWVAVQHLGNQVAGRLGVSVAVQQY